MGAEYNKIIPKLEAFIKDQKIFFVGTAADSGRVNISPKGMDSLRVVNENKIVWLNLTGSGNETAAHLLKDNRITLMFCSFDAKPLILKIYGEARSFHEQNPEFDEYKELFPDYMGTRQFIEIKVDLVLTSCGFGVPFMEYIGERPTLKEWGENKGDKKIKEYWKQKNVTSIDGFETGIFDEN